jgi:RNA polymerase sigma factor (sigma-70 family)
MEHPAAKREKSWPLGAGSVLIRSRTHEPGEFRHVAIETLGAALRQINRLFAHGAATGLSDAQLLERFVRRQDAAAFEALVDRHGPMVLSVCRGLLRDPNDAEDAFQATFLVLVEKAGSIGGRVVLGGWVYRVAQRIALRANLAAARRRAHERRAAQMASATSTRGPSAHDELRAALHQEIGRLPEKHRLAILLCDLEGLAQAEAASQLCWSERTLRRRLAAARDRLKTRLTHRGLAPGGAVLGAVLVAEARAAVPQAWSAAVVRAALDSVNPLPASGAISVAAQALAHEVLKVMFVHKLTWAIAAAALLCAGLIVWAAPPAWVTRGIEPGKKAPAPLPVARRLDPAPAPQPPAKPDPSDAVGTFPVHGHVLGPDGKPVAGAEIFIRHRTLAGGGLDRPAPNGQHGRVANSDADGRFRFDLDKASSDFPYENDPAWYKAHIAATAPGFAMAWVDAGSLASGAAATLRLARDDVPVRGRVLDLQGRPKSGVTVWLRRIGTFKEGCDLDAMLGSGELDQEQIAAWYGYDETVLPGGPNTWTTDADGRFEVKGIGHDRVGWLEFHGPMLAESGLYVMARPAKRPLLPRPHLAMRGRGRMFDLSISSPSRPLVAATFEHVAGPAKPITGVVRFKDTGRPVQGAMVNGWDEATGTSIAAWTDVQGHFRLEGLPKGEIYKLHVVPRRGIDLFLGAEITVTDTAGLKPIETLLEVPRGVIVTGRLIDTANARPVGARMVMYSKLPTNLNQGDASRLLCSLTDPTFRIVVPPGGGLIYAEARGRALPYTRARLRKADKGKGVGGAGDGEAVTVLLDAYHAYKIIDVPAGAQSFSVDLELSRALSRKGRVVDADGKPLAGTQCYGLSAAWGEMKTLSDDTFEARGLEPERPRQLIFAHKGRRLVGSVILQADDIKSDKPLVVRLDRPGTVKGRLVDEDGLPMAGASLWVSTFAIDGSNLPSGPGQGGMWPDSETVSTNADGRFQIDGLKPGVRSSAIAAFKDRPAVRLNTGRALRDLLIVKPGEVLDLGDVKVEVARQEPAQ